VWLCVASSVSGITRDYLLWIKQSKTGLDSEPVGRGLGWGCDISSHCCGLLGMKLQLNHKRNELAFVFVSVTNSQRCGAVRLLHRVWPLFIS